MCVRVVSQVSSTKTLHKPIDTNTMAVYDNQTKMYLNNEFYDKVFVEYDPDTETHYIRRVSDGHYLSAHEDQKHVFWTEPNTNIWTWEQMTLSTLGETPHILMTPTARCCTSTTKTAYGRGIRYLHKRRTIPVTLDYAMTLRWITRSTANPRRGHSESPPMTTNSKKKKKKYPLFPRNPSANSPPNKWVSICS